MDLKRLKTFTTVAEHGTVSKAAQVLSITQPALSRQINALELDLGFKLFNRAKRRLALTARGEQLLDDCRNLLSQAGTLKERAQALRRGDIKLLRIAASPLTIECALPSFLHRYAERNPGVRLSLVEADADEHLNMLERGEVHLAVNVINIVHVDDHRFGSYLLPKFRISAAYASAMKIDATGAIEMRKLCQNKLLLLDPSYATRKLFDAACQLAGLRPSIFMESGSLHALLALAEEGHGVAIIPSILRINRKAIRTLPVMHRREPLEISLAVLWDKRRTLPQYAEGFSELLAAHMRALFPVTKPSRVKAAGSAR